MKKIIITGASGLLGRAVLDYFLNLKNEFQVIGLCNSRALPGLISLDLTSSSRRSFFEKENPDIIIHCAAEKRPDVSEKNVEATRKINVDATEFLAQFSKERNVKFLYISTDYVFDGKNAPYSEEDETHPLNEYGLSKLNGESKVRELLLDAIILRVPVLYGKTIELKESAINILWKDVLDSTPKSIDHYHIRYPTCVDDVAKVLHLLLNSKANGTFHFSASEKFTKYEICLLFSKVLNQNAAHLLAMTDTLSNSNTTRPFDCHLKTEKLKEWNCMPLQLTSFENWILENQSLFQSVPK